MNARVLSAALAAATGDGTLGDVVPVSGGCINQCYAVRRADARLFVKVNRAGLADAFAAEADGLAALGAAGMRVPAVIGHGTAADHAFLVLEHLALRRSSREGFRALGAMLATVHLAEQPACGWHRDNYIGATPQSNAVADEWAVFWVTRRLQPQLALAARRGHRLSAAGLPGAARAVLARHAVRPALLHGDLWSGNAAFLDDGGPVVFDPAVYCGDPDADLAMTELFGGFPAAFYEAYREVRPGDAGYPLRRTLYNLYHVLNHLNLFGDTYLGQAQSMIDELTAAAGDAGKEAT